jgi:hypothetical protein
MLQVEQARKNITITLERKKIRAETGLMFKIRAETGLMFKIRVE